MCGVAGIYFFAMFKAFTTEGFKMIGWMLLIGALVGGANAQEV